MISYYFEDTDFIFKGKTATSRWLRLVAESHNVDVILSLSIDSVNRFL